MEKKGHEIIITARNKDVLQKLLLAYDLKFINMGKGTIGNGALGKALYLLYATFKLFNLLIRQKPELVLSFGSTPCAVAAFILKIPHVAFEDTEHAKLNRKLYAPLTSLICTPSCFYENIGKNQFKFNGYMELFYLHSKRFFPNQNIFKELGIDRNERFAFIRFVSWGAFHDIGQKRLTDDEKIKLVLELKKSIRVYISSEGSLPPELNTDALILSPEKVHDILNYATLYIGEGGTMASECAMLGVPSIYINSLPLMGYLKDEKDANLLYHIHNYEEILSKANEIINDSSCDYNKIKDDFLKDKIDPTAFLVWLIENYPSSKEILFKKPEIQYNFR
jgi:predicted glycosyltransferase